MPEPRTLMTGLVVGESPRWHDGRLWFANWGAQQIVAVDLQGNSEIIAYSPAVAGYSIDWLRDGRLLVTGQQLLRHEADGSVVTHADLSGLSSSGWNEIVVDGRGNVYVNSINFKFGEEEFRPGLIAVVTADGTARQVADDIAFPNGMVVTPDNTTLVVTESFTGNLTAFDIADDGSLSNRRVWAALGGPGKGDGICLDTEGAIWCSVIHEDQPACWRVREGGEVLQRLELNQACFACMLGGDDGRTLFLMVADWWGVERMGELFRARTGQVLTVPARAPAGRRRLILPDCAGRCRSPNSHAVCPSNISPFSRSSP
jgi:sugar lactone lactonase YvrE